MREHFASLLIKYMSKNPNIYLLMGDLGFGKFDKIRKDYPSRAINCGASEQAMMGIACGLAMRGKIPFVYSITPFLIFRPFETIRTYIDHEKLNVKLIGSGRFSDYEIDGFSHYAGDDKRFIREFKNIIGLWPETEDDLTIQFDKIVNDKQAYYVNLKK